MAALRPPLLVNNTTNSIEQQVKTDGQKIVTEKQVLEREIIEIPD